MKLPCDECPWRRDVPTGSWPAERFQHLWRECQDDGQALMACHKSREGDEIVCAGYVVVMGFDTVGIRIAAYKDGLQLEQYKSNAPLFSSFEEMLKANNVTLPPRNRRTER